MTPAEKRDITTDLHNKLVAYWHDVDFNWGRNAGSYYTENAVFETLGGNGVSYNNRKEIEAFYAYRVDRGPRVALHAVINFMAEFESDTRVIGHWVCMLHAHDGDAPQVSAPAINISKLTDIYVLEDGEWLIERRSWSPLFRGGVSGTTASADEIRKRVAK